MKAVKACLIIISAMLGFGIIVANGASEKVALFDKEKLVNEMRLYSHDNLAIQFNATEDFDEVTIEVNAGKHGKGKLTVSIYEWDEFYAKTLRKEPVRKKSFEGFGNKITYKFDTLPKGEYILLLNKASGKAVNIKIVEKSINNVRVYYNDRAEPSIGVAAYVRFISGNGKKLGEISENKSDEPILEFDYFNPVDDREYKVRPDTWAAVDGLGRILPAYKDVGNLKDKKVGIFYTIWFEEEYSNSITPYSLQKLMTEYPDARLDPIHRLWSTIESQSRVIYYWNEPLYGYYSGTDAFVYRKHAELLADAGVDFIVFDCTNATYLWRAQFLCLVDAFMKAKSEGVKVPQFAFFLNSRSQYELSTQLDMLYRDIFARGLYQDLWFYLDGKPLIMANKNILDNEKHKYLLDSFTFRANSGDYADKHNEEIGYWQWLRIHPQGRFGVRKDGSVEYVPVSVAQNGNRELPGFSAMNQTDPKLRPTGRSWTYKNGWIGDDDFTEGNIISKTKLQGLNFQEQWDYAHEVDPDIVFIVGWNEWTVHRYAEFDTGHVKLINAFVDQFDDENSRDIEMTKGDLKDHYYYQMVSNIRKFKGMSVPDAVNAYKKIDILKGVEQWKDVYPEYHHYTGSTPYREAGGFRGAVFEANDTMRNDFVLAKVAYDENNIYFFAQTKDDITPYTDKAWMRLFIDTTFEGNGNWEGFEFCINRENATVDKVIVERSKGGWDWDKVGEARYTVSGNVMQIEVPKEYLGISGKAKNIAFNFKWSDNMQSDGDIMDFYQFGDVAPGGRFCFVFNTDENFRKLPSKKSVDYVMIAVWSVALILVGLVIFLAKKAIGINKKEG